MPKRKCPLAEAMVALARHMRSPIQVRLSEQDKALLTFPDPNKGQKPTGECFSNNCNGNHRWQERPRTRHPDAWQGSGDSQGCWPGLANTGRRAPLAVVSMTSLHPPLLHWQWDNSALPPPPTRPKDFKEGGRCSRVCWEEYE